MFEQAIYHLSPIGKLFEKHALASAEAAFLGVSGMGCARCAKRVRHGLLSVKGVLYADVHLANKVATVAYDPKSVTLTRLVTAIHESGNDGRHEYCAHLMQTMPASEAFTVH